ncbi:amidohydrolase family protein [Hymenobacter sp. PAMC 26628]|uniref:amidohydrolase family protein n=1 Tax=Hymenobacter sp. PAMC 26628 TaxID=1484118 RepID=UPI0007703775|nr:amidohydrolase family protein [Hymenobacter sp. PAMC 26628]AMJ66029.1 hypothetical protein AXW84_11745 [Hymenobacter sp. PAMC 26628]
MSDQTQATPAPPATGRRLTGIIDVHSHATFDIGAGPPRLNQPKWTAELALAMMDANEVAATVLTLPYAANKAEGAAARDIARRVNEQLAAVVQKYPTRFTALATVPGRDIDGTLAEMSYALDTLGLDGVSTETSINDVYLGDARYTPWFEEMNRRGTTLFAHPAFARASEPLSLGLNPSLLEFMFDSTRMLTNLVLTGTKERFSAINIITTHAGGTLPFLLTRLQTLTQAFGTGEGQVPLTPEQLRAGFASFYYDLTAATSPAQLYALAQLVPPARLLMGFDLPFMPDWSFAPTRHDVENWSGFADADLPLVAHDNALGLFPGLAGRLA